MKFCSSGSCNGDQCDWNGHTGNGGGTGESSGTTKGVPLYIFVVAALENMYENSKSVQA